MPTGIKYFKFWLNSVEVDPPMDWQDTQLIFTESKIIRGLVFQQAVPVKFVGSSYTLIKDEFDSALCNSIDVKIQMLDGSGYTDIFNGIIFLNDVTFDLIRCYATVEMKDNSFLGKIENNKDIKFQIKANRSKNDFFVTAITQLPIDFFTPSTGVYDVLNVESYECGEVLRYLIQLMTDDTLDSQTTYLDSSGLVFTSGRSIKNAGSTNNGLYISFKDAFEELNKKLNLSFIVAAPLSDSPTIIIEPYNDNYIETVNESLISVSNIEMKADKSYFYEKVQIGSNNTQDTPSLFTFPQPQFAGFVEEEYHLLGVCNSSETLDLVGSFIVDSNIIEDIIVNANDEYDEDIFIVQTDGVQATRFDEIVDFYYNGTLTNESAILNWFGGIPNSIALYLGSGDDGFIAHKAAAQTLPVFQGGATYNVVPVTYTNEIIDPNGNYTSASSYFTAPLAGTYSFFASAKVSIIGMTSGEATFLALELVRYTDNTFTTEVEFIDYEIRSVYGSAITPVNVAGALYLEIGETVMVRLKGRKDATVTDVNDVEVQISDGVGSATGSEPQFNCAATANGGGVYQTFNEDEVSVLLYKINGHPMTLEQFKNIVNNIGLMISIGNINKSGWINELTWTPYKGICNITLRSNA